MSITIKKLRIYAMLMRIQEIQEERLSKQIILIGGGRSYGKILAMGMDFGPVTIIKKPIPIEEKKFEPFHLLDNDVFLSNDTPSKYFGKPKNK